MDYQVLDGEEISGLSCSEKECTAYLKMIEIIPDTDKKYSSNIALRKCSQSRDFVS